MFTSIEMANVCLFARLLMMKRQIYITFRISVIRAAPSSQFETQQKEEKPTESEVNTRQVYLSSGDVGLPFLPLIPSNISTIPYHTSR